MNFHLPSPAGCVAVGGVLLASYSGLVPRVLAQADNFDEGNDQEMFFSGKSGDLQNWEEIDDGIEGESETTTTYSAPMPAEERVHFQFRR